MKKNNLKSSYGETLFDLVKGVIEKEDGSIIRAAQSLDFLIETEEIPKKYEFLVTLYAALAYDIINEPFAAERLYRSLSHIDPPELSYFTLSENLSKNLTDIFQQIGLRKYSELEINLSEISKNIKTIKNFYEEKLPEIYQDDYVVFFSLLSILRKFFFSIFLQDKEKIQEVLAESNQFFDELSKFDPDSWISLISDLYLALIRRVSERSIIFLDISEKMKKTLSHKKINELWKPQKNAIKLGLLEGKNIFYSSPPGTGKSFLAYLSAGKLSDNEQTVYLLPSKSLSTQVFEELTDVVGEEYNIAISNRDRSVDDDNLDDVSIVVATYEKMDALLRRGKISPNHIRTVIIDEMQFLGDPQRGLVLELMMTKFMNAKSERPIQLIGLSGLLSNENSSELAKWMNARLVLDKWKGVETDEMIYYNGNLHHKNGDVEPTQVYPNPKIGVGKNRTIFTSYFAKNAILKNEPILISVMRRDLAPKLAGDLKSLIGTYNFLNFDLIDKIDSNQEKYQKVIEEIKKLEPELPTYAEELIDMIKLGIVYHHAGLPIRYRQIIEKAIKENLVDVVVTTTTLEAGMNFPIKTVLFFDPKVNVNKKWELLKNRQYQNLAGRAGRPGHHKKANVVVLATNPEEFKNFRKQFWYSPLEPIRSSFYEVISKNEHTLSRLRSQLLGYIVENENSNLNSLFEYLTATWYWKQSKSVKGNESLLTTIKKEVDQLKSYGFLVEKDIGNLCATRTGRVVNDSMLLPDSAVNIIKCIDSLIESENDEEELINFILIMAGLSTEIHNNNSTVKNVLIPKKIEELKSKFQYIENLFLDPIHLNLAMKYASVLYYWINSYSTKELTELCKLSSPSNIAIIEEGVVRDAYWTLGTIATLVESFEVDIELEDKKDELLKLINKVEEFCKLGSKKRSIVLLMSSGISNVGRSTAIKIDEYLEIHNKKLSSLSEEEFVSLFPKNRKSAKLFYGEIQMNRDFFVDSNL